MGLLDEAIREHLELKRRRGADPGEIAHEERAALAPVFPEQGEQVEPDEQGMPIEPDELAQNDELKHDDEQAPHDALEQRDELAQDDELEQYDELEQSAQPEQDAVHEPAGPHEHIEALEAGGPEHLEALERATGSDGDGQPVRRTPRGEVASVGQETAELDMRELLDGDGSDAVDRANDAAIAGPAAPGGASAAATDGAAGADEPLDWELPAHAGEDPPQEIPGQERMSFE
jgi:hypothetical protein